MRLELNFSGGVAKLVNAVVFKATILTDLRVRIPPPLLT